MTMDDALHERKANSGSREFFLAVKPLENSEKFARMPHVETRAIVFHIVDRFPILPLL
jgi:hypothetical protein